ncbi:MAG: hypothetical protein QOD40_1926 [Alphaproteobacteria bacterium]|jgi:hypothetical protein|nr:hypothetical protein [Alphaproteobacteria bacterium]
MRWEKKGLIFKTDNNYPWMLHHACVPIAEKVDDNVLRIYFGPRDREERTVTTFIEVEADNPARLLYVHDRPVLSLGQLGAFDDSGAMPSCIVNHDGKKYLFYIGWNRGVTVPYRNSIGLAVSIDGGLTFERVFEGPIVDRTSLEPYFCASPFAMIDEGKWKLWYASVTSFLEVNGKPEPVYQVKYAESADGREWARPNLTCLRYLFDGEANARPCVIKERGIYRMWYCFRGSVNYRTDKAQSYRIGYAESADGTRWERMDDRVGIDRAEEGWDSVMIEYPFVYEHRGVKHMLYNGNGFGESGFGYAVLVEDDRSGLVTSRVGAL